MKSYGLLILLVVAILPGCDVGAKKRRAVIAPASGIPAADEGWDAIGALIDEGEIHDAIGQCEVMKQKYPKSGLPYVFLQRCHQHGGELELARQACLAGLEVEPGSAELHSAHADTLLEMGEAEEALKAIDKGIEVEQDDPAALYYQRGYTFEHLAQFDSAADSYRQALMLDPSDFWAKNNLASILCLAPLDKDRDGVVAETLARELVKTALATAEDQQLTYAWDTLGSALAEQGRFEEAIESAQKALNTADGEERILIERNIGHYRGQRASRYKSDGSGDIMAGEARD